MYEFLTGLFMLLASIFLLFALYLVKSSKKSALFSLLISVFLYAVCFASYILDNKIAKNKKAFQEGKRLMCKKTIVHKDDGWKLKDDYLIRDKTIFFIKACNEHPL